MIHRRTFMSIAALFMSAAASSAVAQYSGRQHDRGCLEQLESATLAVVTQRACNPVSILEQGNDCVLHMHLNTLVDSVVLQRADHFEAGAIAYVGQARVSMTAEIPLQNPAVFCAIE